MLGTGGGAVSERDDSETAGAGERDECCERRLSRDATDRDAIDGVIKGGGENGSGRWGPLIISGVPRSSNVRSNNMDSWPTTAKPGGCATRQSPYLPCLSSNVTIAPSGGLWPPGHHLLKQ